MDCRTGCAACCIAPSITSPMPGLPQGKPAGVACPHLDAAWRCRLFGRPERPAVCASLRPSAEMCGRSRDEALAWLVRLEVATAPASPAAAPRRDVAEERSVVRGAGPGAA
ncbi:proteinase inhibitor [Piscinibacter sakaiensis]|uniref:Proteinase inhibitor n=1 Tax=Piscinibacter sakaiensis TaxID=1547922 RepID=A0A0K8NXG6_PISS1|nr:proteinase inhibitor [Piscinibacter sakaiensis]